MEPQPKNNIIARALEQTQAQEKPLSPDFTRRLMARIECETQRKAIRCERRETALSIVACIGVLAALVAGTIHYFDLDLWSLWSERQLVGQPLSDLQAFEQPLSDLQTFGGHLPTVSGAPISLYSYVAVLFLGLLLLDGYLRQRLARRIEKHPR